MLLITKQLHTRTDSAPEGPGHNPREIIFETFYVLSHIVSKLLRIIGQMFVFDRERGASF